MHTKARVTAVALLLTTAGCTADIHGSSGSGVGGPGPGAEPTTTSLGELLPSSPPAAGRPAPLTRPDTPTGPDLGFPHDLLLLPNVLFVPAGATIRASSATTSGGRTQLTLEATVDGGCGGVLVPVRRWFTGGGFTETSTRETPDHADLTFVRDDGTVTVATTARNGTCVLAELGVLAVAQGTRR